MNKKFVKVCSINVLQSIGVGLFDDGHPDQFQGGHNGLLAALLCPFAAADFDLGLHFLATLKMAQPVDVAVVDFHLPVLGVPFGVWLFYPDDLLGEIGLRFHGKNVRDEADQF